MASDAGELLRMQIADDIERWLVASGLPQGQMVEAVHALSGTGARGRGAWHHWRKHPDALSAPAYLAIWQVAMDAVKARIAEAERRAAALQADAARRHLPAG